MYKHMGSVDVLPTNSKKIKTIFYRKIKKITKHNYDISIHLYQKYIYDIKIELAVDWSSK